MSSGCISSCVNDTINSTVAVPRRIRATYVSVHRWPESEAEFVRAMNSGSNSSSVQSATQPKLVDSMISCRQVYVRSYKFTREKTIHEKTVKCYGTVKEKVADGKNKLEKKGREEKKKVRMMCSETLRRVKEVPCYALRDFFMRLLFCTASVDAISGK